VPAVSDAPTTRRLGTTSCGFGLFSERIGYDRDHAMFHGDDEQVDQDSLPLPMRRCDAVAREILS
jgi:hypothetical protein